MDINDFLNSEQLKIILEKLSTVASETVNITAEVIRMQSIGHLLMCIIGVIITAVCYKIVRFIWAKIDDPMTDTDIEMYTAGLVISVIVGVVVSVLTTLQLINVWMWVGIFDPKLALARMIFEKVFN